MTDRPLAPTDPAGRRLLETLVGMPYEACTDITRVTLTIVPREFVTVAVERVIDDIDADDIVATFVDHKLVVVQ